MEFVTGNWGALVSVVGLVVSSVGLIWAIVVARGARSASQAAQKAAQETSAYIARHLQATNLERAIALVQRLKLLHRKESWEGSLELYQMLRMMLYEIAAHFPDAEAGPRRDLAVAIQTVRNMENWVESQSSLGLLPQDKARLHRQLNEIQSGLESLASTRGFDSFQGETS